MKWYHLRLVLLCVALPATAQRVGVPTDELTKLGGRLLDARLGWHPTRATELSSTLRNLTDKHVFETLSEGVTPAIATRRIFLVRWTQRF